MAKAIILFSGGLDSTTCLAIARDAGFECYALSIDYGQRLHSELAAAKQIFPHYGVKEHRILSLGIGELGGSALTDMSIDVPNYTGAKEIKETYVPARNTIFLSVALGWAEIIGADVIYMGVNAVDYSNYPDCRPEYIRAFQTMANLATKTGVEGKQIEIRTPLIHLSKAEIIKLGLSLGVDYSKTVTCYQATSTGQACGTCDACTFRRRGFEQANATDPTNYV